MTTAFNASQWLVDRHVAAGGGERLAFQCQDRSLTYTGLMEATWAAANGLSSVGVSPCDRVLMLVADEEAFPAAFLGGLRTGAIPIPVSTMLRPREVAALAADCGAKAVVVSDRHSACLPEVAAAAPAMRAAIVVGPATVPVGEEARTGASDLAGVGLHAWSDFDDRTEPAGPSTGADSPGFWLYTSGTTGTPKGAIHRHGDIKVVAESYARTVLGIGPEDVT
jgi:acyl-coenzyme A synthetase/AMP-(fatty) acid ligase